MTHHYIFFRYENGWIGCDILKKAVKLTKVSNLHIDKIGVFFKRSILKSIVKILVMEHNGFRTFKSIKNINRLFTNIDLSKYKKNKELESYIWCINYISKQWLDGIVTIDLIIEGAKRHPEFDNIKEGIISSCISDPNIISAPEAKMVFDLISDALQYGFVTSMREEYQELLEDIDLNNPGAFKEVMNRLFLISKSLIDIQHNTNLVSNQITFNSADLSSIKEAVSKTITSLQGSGSVLKTGIRRLNTLLSPGYMAGRLYCYIGLPGSFKSGILLKTALDIRKYNEDFETKTPGMKPCALYITMENTFTETIERIWNMIFDDSITNYSEDEAVEKLSDALGFHIDKEEDSDGNADRLQFKSEEPNQNIEIVIKYFPYREISTDDLFTIIQDLREDNMEVCCLIFDYIKRIRPATVMSSDTTKTELARIINELKALAVIDDIPVVTAHQSNRAGAAAVDNAVRQGKGDVTKLVGRENTGDAWEIVETVDWGAFINIEYKPGTDEKYLVISVVKRRRIDSSEAEFAKYTYIAHPFARENQFRLLDDMNQEKILSLKSLVSDIDLIGKEKTNAVSRLKNLETSEFDEDYE